MLDDTQVEEQHWSRNGGVLKVFDCSNIAFDNAMPGYAVAGDESER